jgi:quercetin dioxygenase-like cupin family protein
MARRLLQAARSGRDPPDHDKEGRTAMAAKAEQKTFATPDETRTFENGKVELVHVGNSDIGRLTLEPGWRWSEHVKPIAGTDSCEAPHFQYHVAGTLRIRMDDGQEFEAKAGDVTALPQGHDAWVVGDQAVVLVDWWGASNYAKA